MKEDKKYINFKYLNSQLEILKGVPAYILFFLLIPLVFMNLQSLILTFFLIFLSIYLSKQGYSHIEMSEMLKYIKRKNKLKLYKFEEDHE